MATFKPRQTSTKHQKTGKKEQSIETTPQKKNIGVQSEKVDIGVETTKKVVMSMKTERSSGPEETLKNGSEKLF
ncbi:hypothetical protein HHI36_006106 [Cryptolaemus montrouzieri]|uniref:Uncharacterized protein n=1 Tax=Cryptolaemus montrouzieri TaxID=559131 RepID=A0ABD2NW95_9CUCU